MENNLRIPNRRNLDRLEMIYPAMYIRHDNQGRACDQRISRSVNLSLAGVRLQSSFSVAPGEMLDVTLALKNNLVTFKGEVIHVTSSGDEDFELGISIKDIEDGDRVALSRFLFRTQRDVIYVE